MISSAEIARELSAPCALPVPPWGRDVESVCTNIRCGFIHGHLHKTIILPEVGVAIFHGPSGVMQRSLDPALVEPVIRRIRMDAGIPDRAVRWHFYMKCPEEGFALRIRFSSQPYYQSAERDFVRSVELALAPRVHSQ